MARVYVMALNDSRQVYRVLRLLEKHGLSPKVVIIVKTSGDNKVNGLIGGLVSQYNLKLVETLDILFLLETPQTPSK